MARKRGGGEKKVQEVKKKKKVDPREEKKEGKSAIFSPPEGEGRERGLAPLMIVHKEKREWPKQRKKRKKGWYCSYFMRKARGGTRKKGRPLVTRFIKRKEKWSTREGEPPKKRGGTFRRINEKKGFLLGGSTKGKREKDRWSR